MEEERNYADLPQRGPSTCIPFPNGQPFHLIPADAMADQEIITAPGKVMAHIEFEFIPAVGRRFTIDEIQLARTLLPKLVELYKSLIRPAERFCIKLQGCVCDSCAYRFCSCSSRPTSFRL